MPKLQRRQPPRAVVAHRMSVIHRTRRSTSLDRSTACTHPRATRVHAEFAEWWRLGHRHRHGPRSPRRSASGVEIYAAAHRSSPSTAQTPSLLSRHLSRSLRHARTADERAGRDYEGRGTAFADGERSLVPSPSLGAFPSAVAVSPERADWCRRTRAGAERDDGTVNGGRVIFVEGESGSRRTTGTGGLSASVVAFRACFLGDGAMPHSNHQSSNPTLQCAKYRAPCFSPCSWLHPPSPAHRPRRIPITRARTSSIRRRARGR